jgi:uncharacterized phosphosugar-binding protein
MNLAQRFLDRVRQLLDELEATQMESIERAGRLVADTMASGGAFVVGPIGHGITDELLHRGGGLMALKRFNPTWNLTAADLPECLRGRPRTESVDVTDEMLLASIRASELRPGDCVLIGSVSGRTAQYVALTLALQKCGIKVIALVALDYAAEVTSAHHSGKMINEIADVCLDLKVPFGDACLEVEGLETPALPLSGVSEATISWMLCATVIETLLNKGLTPSIYRSANRVGGPEFNQEAEARCQRQGY